MTTDKLEALEREIREWGDSPFSPTGLCLLKWANTLAAIRAEMGGVTEAMVERAREAYYNTAEIKDGVFTTPDAMRAALVAALTDPQTTTAKMVLTDPALQRQLEIASGRYESLPHWMKDAALNPTTGEGEQ